MIKDTWELFKTSNDIDINNFNINAIIKIIKTN